jgi:hypothetical protein
LRLVRRQRQPAAEGDAEAEEEQGEEDERKPTDGVAGCSLASPDHQRPGRDAQCCSDERLVTGQTCDR